jgi:hypothetical protein
MNIQPINSIHSDEVIFESCECINNNNETHYVDDDKHNTNAYIGIDYIATDVVINTEE